MKYCQEVVEGETMDPGGQWYNELGSKMQIRVSGSRVSGTYCSAVGDASRTYDLFGAVDPDPYTYSQAISWTVAWSNSSGNAHSVTCYSDR